MIWHWKGPAPHHFLWVPQDESSLIKSLERQLTYGWGCIPVEVTLGSSTWTTSLIPKDGRYLVPLRAKERKDEGAEVGDEICLDLRFEMKSG